MWMNEGEIDQMVEFTKYDAPEFAPYAQYLSDWRDIVNENSDGWPYWSAGTGCAEKLMGALQALKNSYRHGEDAPDDSLFRRALTPIKSLATRKNLPAPTLESVQHAMKM